MFTARDSAGLPQTGTVQAASRLELAQDLRRRGWLVLQVQEQSSDDAAEAGWLGRVNPRQWLPVRPLDVEMALRQLAVMLRSGLTLLSSLRTAAEQSNRYAMGRVLDNLADRIEQGSTLADAMANHRCFDRLLVQLVRVGEQTGTLEQVLLQASVTLERRRNLRATLLTAMAYPAFVVVLAGAVTAVMLLFVIPRIERMLVAMGRPMPTMTQWVIDISNTAVRWSPQILTAGLTVTIVLTGLYLWRPGRLMLDRLVLRLPVIGMLLRVAATAMFARALAILLRSGVRLLDALHTSQSLHRNQHLAELIAAARQRVLNGESLARPLMQPFGYTPMLGRMVAVGESAGTLDEVLDELSLFHETQLQAAIRRFSVMVGPVLIFVVGGIVGFVYIAFFLALFAASGVTG